MFINLLRYSLRQCFQSLFRNLGLSLAAAGVIAVTLLVLGSFLLVAVNTDRLVQQMGSEVEIGVFLEEDASSQEVENHLNQLAGVQDFSFISREEALEMMAEDLRDEDLLQDIEGEHNPLPDAFRVQAREAEEVTDLAAQLEEIPGVEEANYGGELLEGVLRITRWINVALLGGGILLAAAAVFLILTTVRLSLLYRSEEISIMKYLGASNWFVRLPFLLEGMIIGWSGTLVAVILLALGYYYLASSTEQIEMLFAWQPATDPAVLYPVWLGLLAAGTIIGGLGSLWSLRKFLKV